MCLLHWKPSEGCELTFSLNFLLKLYAGRKRFSFFLFGVEVTFSAGWVQLYGHKGGEGLSTVVLLHVGEGAAGCAGMDAAQSLSSRS